MHAAQNAPRPARTPLSAAAVTTILPVRNLDRARRFYVESLGLEGVGTKPDGQYLLRTGDGGTIALFPKPEGTKAEHTAVTFAVDDLEAAIATLEKRGVAFHDYDLPGFRTVNHICTQPGERCAWVSDTEGTVLCVHQDTRGVGSR
jgi:catechol 2,3-dioxygenase-like lactoylglutathione lyase family enzyme